MQTELVCQAYLASPDFSELDEQLGYILGNVKFSLSDHMSVGQSGNSDI